MLNKNILLNAIELQAKVAETAMKLARLEKAFDALQTELAEAMVIIRNNGFQDEK